MGVGLGQAIAACVAHPDRPVIHQSAKIATKMRAKRKRKNVQATVSQIWNVQSIHSAILPSACGSFCQKVGSIFSILPKTREHPWIRSNASMPAIFHYRKKWRSICRVLAKRSKKHRMVRLIAWLNVTLIPLINSISYNSSKYLYTI
jgi:hypothetical protein